MKERNQSIELFRVLLMFLIVLFHLSARVFDISTFSKESTFIIVHSIRSICVLGVSCFAFISGYYGISFKIEKFIKYEIMALFWGILGLLIAGMILNYFNVRMLFPTSSGELWYFSSYMVLMILSPFINSSLEILKLNRLLFRNALFFLVFIEYGCLFLLPHGLGGEFLVIITLYLIGRYFRFFSPIYLELHGLRLALICMLLNMILTACGGLFILKKFDSILMIRLMESNHNPLVLLSSLGLFYYFKNQKVISIPWLAKLSPYMFAVYVIHAYLLHITDSYDLLRCYSFIVWIFSSVAVFLLCIFLECLRINLISDKIENNIVTLVKKKLIV